MERLNEIERHDSMRGYFAYEVYNHMVDNKDIWVVLGDLGYMMWDKARKDFPDRVINVGAAEESMVGICVGLAEGDKIPIAYSITPFLLYRPFETINTYIHGEGSAVKLVGSGRQKDYLEDGKSHWALDDARIMKNIFTNIEARWPEAKEDIPDLVTEMIETPKPYYINLKR
jgi:transketolase